MLVEISSASASILTQLFGSGFVLCYTLIPYFSSSAASLNFLHQKYNQLLQLIFKIFGLILMAKLLPVPSVVHRTLNHLLFQCIFSVLSSQRALPLLLVGYLIEVYR